MYGRDKHHKSGRGKGGGKPPIPPGVLRTICIMKGLRWHSTQASACSWRNPSPSIVPRPLKWCSWLADGFTPTYAVIVGTEGTIRFDDPFLPPGAFVVTSADGSPTLRYGEPCGRHFEGLYYEAAEVARRVRAGELETRYRSPRFIAQNHGDPRHDPPRRRHRFLRCRAPEVAA